MPQNITDVSTFTDPVTAPADGDALDAASVIDNGIQALSNRTRKLADRTGGGGGTGEFAYDDAPRTRARTLSPFMMTEGRLQVAAVQNWSVPSTLVRTSQSDFAILVDDVGRYLPEGAFLIRVDVMVAPGTVRATVGDRMEISLTRHQPDWLTPAAIPFATSVFSVTDDGTSSVQVVQSGAINEEIFRITNLILRIRAGNDAGTNKDDVQAIRLVYTVPGPNAF